MHPTTRITNNVNAPNDDKLLGRESAQWMPAAVTMITMDARGCYHGYNGCSRLLPWLQWMPSGVTMVTMGCG